MNQNGFELEPSLHFGNPFFQTPCQMNLDESFFGGCNNFNPQGSGCQIVKVKF